jgi:hypothetical protein
MMILFILKKWINYFGMIYFIAFITHWKFLDPIFFVVWEYFLTMIIPYETLMNTTKVVKIAFWLVKSYDFTSQNMLYVLNRLKKSKMGEIGLNWGEIAKIGWNRAKSRFQDRFCDCAKMMRWNKIPPWSSCQTPIGCGNAQSRDCLLFSSVFTNHNSQNTISIFQPNKSLIG